MARKSFQRNKRQSINLSQNWREKYDCYQNTRLESISNIQSFKTPHKKFRSMGSNSLLIRKQNRVENEDNVVMVAECPSDPNETKIVRESIRSPQNPQLQHQPNQT
jgi:hypothetical protein